MRVSFVLPKLGISGGTRIVLMFAHFLKKRGYTVSVVAPISPKPSLKTKISLFLKGKGWIKYSPYDMTYIKELSLDIDPKLLDQTRPVEDRDLPDGDVVIATWWETAEWVNKLSPSKGAKAIFIQQLESNFGSPVDRVEATWRLPFQKIVCSKWLDELAKNKFDDPNAIVVPNGVDTCLFNAPERSKQTIPTIGFLYYPSALVKGTGTALAAIEMVKKKIPNLIVNTFGIEKLNPKFPLPPGSQFQFRPPQSSIPSIYSKCDVWLCSSTSEGFHLPPHEAMACRCPVVSTKVGGPTDLIDNGVNGYLVDVGDVSGLAEGLYKVLSASEKSWREMSDAAYEKARIFNWQKATDLFEEALHKTTKRFGKGVSLAKN